jgi:1-acyl-sn-glycerol-3-phosphate acyltransferase
LIKALLAKFFAAWAVIIFIVLLLIVFLPMWITGLWKEPRRSYLMQGIFTNWMRVYFFLTGLRLQVKGKENFEKGKNYVVVFNHNSLMDPPVSTPFMPGANKTIAKAEMARIPLFGMIYKRGSVLVDRRKEDSRKQSYMKMKEVVEMGLHMVIYPEGTRNKSSEPLQRFHDGAFRLAVDTGKPIMPAILFNTAKVLPPGKGFYFWPSKIRLHYLPAVDPANFASVEALREAVWEIMRKFYSENK